MSFDAYKKSLDAELKRQLEPTVNGVKNNVLSCKTHEYAESIKAIKENQVNAGKAGFNEYGVPLHACNGYIQNAHYWAWMGEKNRLKPLNWIAPCRVNDIRV